MAATSIKVAIPRDIQDFEARFIGPLTKRQTVLFIISSVIGYGLFKLLGIFKMELANYDFWILGNTYSCMWMGKDAWNATRNIHYEMCITVYFCKQNKTI